MKPLKKMETYFSGSFVRSVLGAAIAATLFTPGQIRGENDEPKLFKRGGLADFLNEHRRGFFVRTEEEFRTPVEYYVGYTENHLRLRVIRYEARRRAKELSWEENYPLNGIVAKQADDALGKIRGFRDARDTGGLGGMWVLITLWEGDKKKHMNFWSGDQDRDEGIGVEITKWKHLEELVKWLRMTAGISSR